MMGSNHALMGASAGIATLGWCHHPQPAFQAAWVAGWIAGALLPDWDSGSSMASTMWGPASRIIGAPLAALGHRRFTHDLILFPLTLVAAIGAAGQHPWSRMVLVAVLLGLATRALLVQRSGWFVGLCTLAVSVGGAWWAVSQGLDTQAQLLVCTVGGVLVHLAGDAPTVNRLPMPIMWLFGSSAKLGIGLFKAGQKFEKCIVTPVNLILLGWISNQRFHWWIWLAPHLHQLTA